MFDPDRDCALFDKANQLFIAFLNGDNGRAGDHVLLRAVAFVSPFLLPAHNTHLHRRCAVSLVLDPQLRGVGICGKPGIDGPEQNGGRRLRLACGRDA